jgi:hypothetical protein
MANPTTAAEWNVVAANAQAQIDAIKAQTTALEMATGLRRNGINFELLALINTRNYALEQATQADTGALGTSTNTAPANPGPGDNTEVNVSPPVPIENNSPAGVQINQPGFLEANQAIENTSSAPVPLTVEQQRFLEANQADAVTLQKEVDMGEFAGVDRQVAAIEAQKYVDQGEFAGVDAAVAANEAIDAQKTVTVGDFAAADQAATDAINTDAALVAASNAARSGMDRGLTAAKSIAQMAAETAATTQAKQKLDWRVRLALAPAATYLYKAEFPGILAPLAATDGVIFPYTPSISVSYAAHYDSQDLTHSNYKINQYRSSSVEQITIGCDFTAQDTFEANYMLAVIHFFRSVTKMFYGQDKNPINGTPPPLCYLFGLGQFQFDSHPLAITNFNYNLPIDVDYIRSGSATTSSGVSKAGFQTTTNTSSAVTQRLNGSKLQAGAQAAPPQFKSALPYTEATYVPTKMSISITAIPIITRADVSNEFSLKDYATGKLLQGSKRQGGGMW